MVQWEGNKQVGMAPGQTGGSGSEIKTAPPTQINNLPPEQKKQGDVSTYTDSSGNIHVVEQYQNRTYDTVVGGFQGGYSGSGYQRTAQSTLSDKAVQSGIIKIANENPATATQLQKGGIIEIKSAPAQPPSQAQPLPPVTDNKTVMSAGIGGSGILDTYFGTKMPWQRDLEQKATIKETKTEKDYYWQENRGDNLPISLRLQNFDKDVSKLISPFLPSKEQTTAMRSENLLGKSLLAGAIDEFRDRPTITLAQGGIVYGATLVTSGLSEIVPAIGKGLPVISKVPIIGQYITPINIISGALLAKYTVDVREKITSGNPTSEEISYRLGGEIPPALAMIASGYIGMKSVSSMKTTELMKTLPQPEAKVEVLTGIRQTQIEQELGMSRVYTTPQTKIISTEEAMGMPSVAGLKEAKISINYEATKTAVQDPYTMGRHTETFGVQDPMLSTEKVSGQGIAMLKKSGGEWEVTDIKPTTGKPMDALQKQLGTQSMTKVSDDIYIGIEGEHKYNGKISEFDYSPFEVPTTEIYIKGKPTGLIEPSIKVSTIEGVKPQISPQQAFKKAFERDPFGYLRTDIPTLETNINRGVSDAQYEAALNSIEVRNNIKVNPTPSSDFNKGFRYTPQQVQMLEELETPYLVTETRNIEGIIIGDIKTPQPKLDIKFDVKVPIAAFGQQYGLKFQSQMADIVKDRNLVLTSDAVAQSQKVFTGQSNWVIVVPQERIDTSLQIKTPEITMQQTEQKYGQSYEQLYRTPFNPDYVPPAKWAIPGVVFPDMGGGGGRRQKRRGSTFGTMRINPILDPWENIPIFDMNTNIKPKRKSHAKKKTKKSHKR